MTDLMYISMLASSVGERGYLCWGGQRICFQSVSARVFYFEIVLLFLAGSSGWDEGENSVLLVLRLGSDLSQCQNRAKGLHTR